MITVSLYHRYRNALIDIASASHDRQHITTDAANLALLLALDELDAAWQERKFNTVDHIDSAAQIIRLNDWLAEHAPDEYHQPGDTADSMIATADRLRGQVAKLRTELAAAIDERNHLDDELRASKKMMNSAHDEAKANAKDAYDLRQQLAQLDADNAALIQRNTALAADLATARSYFLNRPTNGHDITDPLSVSAQSAVETRPATQWDDAAMLSGLDAATLDYWHGINAGRWTWRKLPKTVRLAMVRHVLSFTETDAPMSMSQFDAFKPHWMPGAGTHPVTLGVTWATLADLRTEIEVPA